MSQRQLNLTVKMDENKSHLTLVFTSREHLSNQINFGVILIHSKGGI